LYLIHKGKPVKSQGSLLGGIAFVSLSVISLVCAYKLGKYQHQTDTPPTAQPQHDTVALKEGQTILWVAETNNALGFYIGDGETNQTDEA
jgi:hypothetical protein